MKAVIFRTFMFLLHLILTVSHTHIHSHADLPVISTVGVLPDGGVHFVSDQPGETGPSEESDVFLVRSGHVGAAGMEVSQEHHILYRTQTKWDT